MQTFDSQECGLNVEASLIAGQARIISGIINQDFVDSEDGQRMLGVNRISRTVGAGNVIAVLVPLN